MAHTALGRVTHYYPKIEVAVVDLSAPLSVGNSVAFSGSTDFTQTVTSLQVDHQQINSAASHVTVGLQVDQPVAPGDVLHLVS